jgi:hypothetical protein
MYSGIATRGPSKGINSRKLLLDFIANPDKPPMWLPKDAPLSESWNFSRMAMRTHFGESRQSHSFRSRFLM